MRTTMSESRLTELSLLAIEKHIIETIDNENIINDFAQLKHRRNVL